MWLGCDEVSSIDVILVTHVLAGIFYGVRAASRHTEEVYLHLGDVRMCMRRIGSKA